MSKLKVYGWQGFQHFKGERYQTREIIAAKSAAEVRRVTGMTRSEWEHSGCETGNDEEIKLAMSEPGTTFWTPLDVYHRGVIHGLGWMKVDEEL